MDESSKPLKHGRGAQIRPANRFETISYEDDFEQVEGDAEFLQSTRKVKTVYLPDLSKSIISTNDSPDINFNYSINPYRGCQHGCSYCYARPTHEYLGMDAGLDFESKIMVKEKAPQLFRDFLNRKNWQPELIAMSGVTDCYQPIEKEKRLTRECLKVALEARQPIGIVTKNALVTRDIDLLSEMAKLNIIRVSISVTSLDSSLAGAMEPRTSRPFARLKAIQQLADAGISTGVMVAPVIPGLNDREIPSILKAASEAGAKGASYVLLRLPLAVEPIFIDWLDHHRPDEKDKILSLIRGCREGELYNSEFKNRMQGTGQIAEQIRQTFHVFKRKVGLDRQPRPLDYSQFRPPKSSLGQKRLF